jgi:ABC transporter substrate binding protein
MRRAATYVDKILKGAKPRDLPVEQPTKFEFIINLKAAKQIGLSGPPHFLSATGLLPPWLLFVTWKNCLLPADRQHLAFLYCRVS